MTKLLATVVLIALVTSAFADDAAAPALATRDARDGARGFEWWVQLDIGPDSCRHSGDTGIAETPDEFPDGVRHLATTLPPSKTRPPGSARLGARTMANGTAYFGSKAVRRAKRQLAGTHISSVLRSPRCGSRTTRCDERVLGLA